MHCSRQNRYCLPLGARRRQQELQKAAHILLSACPGCLQSTVTSSLALVCLHQGSNLHWDKNPAGAKSSFSFLCASLPFSKPTHSIMENKCSEVCCLQIGLTGPAPLESHFTWSLYTLGPQNMNHSLSSLGSSLSITTSSLSQSI